MAGKEIDLTQVESQNKGTGKLYVAGSSTAEIYTGSYKPTAGGVITPKEHTIVTPKSRGPFC